MFDVVVGCSAGGIIACGIGNKMDMGRYLPRTSYPELQSRILAPKARRMLTPLKSKSLPTPSNLKPKPLKP